MPTLFSLVTENGQRSLLLQDTFVMGRDPSSDLHIQDIEVSRRHARLIAQSGGHALEDLGSTNGTFVNGQRIRSLTVLRPGDSIRLGETVTLHYEMDAAGLEATPPSARPPRPARPPAPRPAVRPTASLHSLEEPPAIDPLPARLPPTPPELDSPIASPPSGPVQAPLAAPVAPASVKASEPAPAPRRHPRRKGPVIDRRWIMGCGVLALLGLCITIAFLWYVDANLLWCDVFGGVIAACR